MSVEKKAGYSEVEEIVLEKLREPNKPKSVKLPWEKRKVKRPAQNIFPWEIYGQTGCVLSEKQVIQALKELEKKGIVGLRSMASGVWWYLKEPAQVGGEK